MGTGVLEGAFEVNYPVCRALATLAAALRKQAHDGPLSADHAISAAFEALLQRLDLTPFHRRRHHHRTAAAMLPSLIDAAGQLLAADADQSGAELPPVELVATSADTVATTAPDKKARFDAAASASEVESRELVLLDLLHAPEDSYLTSLATLMARIENLSHVLAWAKFEDEHDLRSPEALTANNVRR